MASLLHISTVASFVRAFLLPHAAYFRQKGWRVDAAASGITADAQCSKAFDHVWDMEWSRNPLYPANIVRAPRRIRRLIEQEGYDIVHVHTPVAGFVTRYALRNGPPPVRIYTAHGFHFHKGGSALKNSLFTRLEALAGRWTDHLIVINRYDAAAAVKYGLVPPGKMTYMPGIGIDTNGTYSPASISVDEVAQCRHELGIRPDDTVFVMVAEFIPRKRHQDAIAAMAMLKRPGVHLLFAGEGRTMSAMKNLADRSGVSAKVRFLGIRSDIPALMSAADATLLCSAREGLPRCVLESLSLGTPVIGTDIRGTRELLDNGAGLLYATGDIDGLCRAMGWLMDHRAEAARMARVGRERIVTYDIAHILSMHERVYTEALSTLCGRTEAPPSAELIGGR